MPARSAVVEVSRVDLAAVERRPVAVGMVRLAHCDAAREWTAVGPAVGKGAPGHGIRELARTAVRRTASIARVVEGDARPAAELGAALAGAGGIDQDHGRGVGVRRGDARLLLAGVHDGP
jgi:hypothetical protein